jgi:hypothetical protein
VGCHDGSIFATQQNSMRTQSTLLAHGEGPCRLRLLVNAAIDAHGRRGTEQAVGIDRCDEAGAPVLRRREQLATIA